MKDQNGFSLIELIIVVVIIGIIAAIAIPNLLATRRAANEASAISSLRTFHSAQLNYQVTIGAGNFAGASGSALNNQAFIDLGNAKLIDSVLATGIKSGYRFTGMMVTTGTGTTASFCGRGVPVTVSGITSTGNLKFGVATDGVIQSASALLSFGAGCSLDSNGLPYVSSANPLSN